MVYEGSQQVVSEIGSNLTILIETKQDNVVGPP